MKMKYFTLIFIVLLSGCSNTISLDRIRDIKAEMSVFCDGSTKNVQYKDTEYSTKIICNGNEFTFEKKPVYTPSIFN